ncbi:DUF4124 domain-containing protein [Parashewanella curva]|nr:DUF4124 domain-containing protein [Parashewanella curva]
MRNGLFLCLLLLSWSTMAAVYKWIDKDGNVHYSDKPRPGAVEVKPNVTTLNEMSWPSNKPKAQNEAIPQGETLAAQVTIVSPQDQQTIRDNNGRFEVTAVAQGVSKKSIWRLFINGNPYGNEQTSGRFQVDGLDRGEHKLKVVVNPQGSDAAYSSDEITIYLHRHSKNFPSSPLIRKKASQQ